MAKPQLQAAALEGDHSLRKRYLEVLSLIGAFIARLWTSSRMNSTAATNAKSTAFRLFCSSMSAIRTLERRRVALRCGHYLGSNVSYNLKKLVESGYVHHERSVRRPQVRPGAADA